MGAWAWNDVAAGLRAEGATVTAVELPAHGAVTTPVSEASLGAYVATVAAAVEAHRQPVVLVAHSMAGIVATQLAEDEPDRVAKLVYLAAYVPADGQTLQELAAEDSGSHIGPVLEVDPEAGVARLPEAELADLFCADCDAAAKAAIADGYRDEPIAPFGAPIHTSAERWGAVDKHYLYTEQDNAVSLAFQKKMTQGVVLSSSATLDTSHSPFLSAPDLVTAALLGL